jgi:hypothetical protein
MALFGKRHQKPAIQIVNEIFNDHINDDFVMRERIWYRNILYLIGEQWIDYVVSAGRYVPRRMPVGVPTPVSNLVRDYVRSMRALILNKDFVIKVWPNSEEHVDRDASKLAVQFLEDLEARNDEEFAEEKKRAAHWILLAGTTFMRTIPELERGQIAIDKNGDLIPSGEVVSRHWIPFNVRVPDVGERLRDKRHIGMQSLKEREWVEDTFHVKVKSSPTNKEAVSYQRALSRMQAEVSPLKGAGRSNAMASAPDDDMIVFREVEVRPTASYPDGRYIVAVGDQLIKEFKKLPIPKDTDGRWDYSLTDFHYNYVPGCFWSDAGVNDQISPQNSINQIDQSLEMNRKSVGRPLIVGPPGFQLKRANKGGQSFIMVEFDPHNSAGMTPTVHHGTPLPSQVMDERNIHRSVAQEAAGDPKNILGGQAPSSNASGLMVDILRDAAEQQHTPDIDGFYRSIKRVKKKELLVAQDLYTEKRMIKIAGKGNDIRVKAFKGSDLRGNTDVRMEKASGLSSTNAGQNQALMTMAEKGLFGDITQDPETQQELQRRLGLAGFKGKTSHDVDRANWENSLIANATEKDLGKMPVQLPNGEEVEIFTLDRLHMLRATQTPEGQPVQEAISHDPLFQFDNHDIHFEAHRRFIISPEFRDLPEPVKICAIVHLESHRIEQMHQQAEQMATQTITPGQDEDLQKGGQELDRSQAPSQAI